MTNLELQQYMERIDKRVMELEDTNKNLKRALRTIADHCGGQDLQTTIHQLTDPK